MYDLINLWKKINKNTAHSGCPDISIDYIYDLIIEIMADKFEFAYNATNIERYIFAMIQLNEKDLKTISFYLKDNDFYDRPTLKSIKTAIKNLEKNGYIEKYNNKYKLVDIPF